MIWDDPVSGWWSLCLYDHECCLNNPSLKVCLEKSVTDTNGGTIGPKDVTLSFSFRKVVHRPSVGLVTDTHYYVIL